MLDAGCLMLDAGCWMLEGVNACIEPFSIVKDYRKASLLQMFASWAS